MNWLFAFLFIFHTPLSRWSTESIAPPLAENRIVTNVAIEIDAADPTTATKAPCCQDELWLISARNGLRTGDKCHEEIIPKVSQWSCQSGWQASSLETFLATDDPSRITHIVVHGNGIDEDKAIERGMLVHRNLLKACNRPCIRTVIWSWPAENTGRNIIDSFKINAVTSEQEGYHLARFLGELPPDTPVSLLGYSYGGRVIVAALHIAAGGTVRGRSLAAPIPPRKIGYNFLLLAAAVDAHWLNPGNRFGLALTIVGHATTSMNQKDRVLKRYPKLFGDNRDFPKALGHTGFQLACMDWEIRDRLCNFNVTPHVRKAHRWNKYVSSPAVLQMMRSEALFVRGYLPPAMQIEVTAETEAASRIDPVGMAAQ